MEDFLREGLKRYADAKEAVEVFEREIQDQLVRRLEEKQDWLNFTPLRGERGRGQALESGTYNDEGRRIWASQSAKDDDGWMQLELWWRSDRKTEGVVAACTRYDSNERVTRGCRLPDPRAPVNSGKLAGKPCLYVVIDAAERGLDEVLRLLVKEMDRALGHDRAP